MRHWGKATFGLAVTIFLLWWVLKDVDFREVLANISTGNFWLLGASVFVATFGFFIRALRWKVLLAPVRPDTALRSRFAGVSIGFMANNVLPARMGEFARAFAFSRMEPVSATAAFGTLVVERFMDGVVLLLFLVIPVMTPGFPAADALTAGGGAVGRAVSRSESDLLVDVRDLVAGTDADQEAWHDLFAKAVGNHVMAAAGEVVPSRQEALRREQWLKTPSGGVTSFLSRMFGTRGADLEAAFRSKDPFKERHAKMEKSIAESEIVTLGEAKWLKDRIHRDGDLTEAEKALLRFIKDVSPDVSPVLDALISEAA